MTTTATRPLGQLGSPKPHGRGRSIIIGVVVLVVLIAAGLWAWRTFGGDGATPATSTATGTSAGGASGTKARERIVPDSDAPAVSDITGLWALSCDGVNTSVGINESGSGYYQHAGGSTVLWQVQATVGFTRAHVGTSADPDMPAGSIVILKVKDGKLSFTVGGVDVALFPYSETYNGPIC